MFVAVARLLDALATALFVFFKIKISHADVDELSLLRIVLQHGNGDRDVDFIGWYAFEPAGRTAARTSTDSYALWVIINCVFGLGQLNCYHFNETSGEVR